MVTIGAYDGVHLGHRAVIGDVRRRAAAGGHASAVVTFDRHPAQVIRPESAPLLLTDLDQKLELLAATGVDHTLVVGFDRERAAESAEDFVRTVLVDCLNVRQVVVGEDFHFGHRRAGNVALLEELGGPLGFGVHGHELVGADGRAARDETQVSSTAIRRALVEQLYRPVRWVDCMNEMSARGVDRVAECGPGKVLLGLCKRGMNAAQGFALGTADQMQAAQEQWT